MSRYGVSAPGAGLNESRSSESGVSWGAIFAGAAGAVSLSLILIVLGTGLGMSAVSPWANQGASATAIGAATIAWLTFTQLAARGMGGYLAGRLRTKWVSLHTDEVYLRDTAHGFLAWSVATLLSAALLSSAAGGILGAGTQASATMVGGAATAATTAGAAGAAASPSSAGWDLGGDTGASPMNYFIDSLFRYGGSSATLGTEASQASSTVGPAAEERNPGATRAEVSRIFLNSVRTSGLPPEDAKYVAQVVAQRTGLTQADAERRVNETYTKAQAAVRDAQAKAKEAADAARKASAYASLWLVVSMLVGAFVASFAATYGGRRRDL